MTKPIKEEIFSKYDFLPTASRMETYYTQLEKYIKVLEHRNKKLENKLINFKLKTA